MNTWKDRPYIAQIVGTQELWEPLWRLKTSMTDAEVKLLHSSALRRLQYIHHGGCSYMNTQHNTTRLQHTLGVYSLIAYLCPDWPELRIAALLHDIGHSPFSHTLEQLGGIDHHQLTERLLFSSEVNGILSEHGFQANEILDIINGAIESPLCNRSNCLQLDHLDSWARSGHITGALSISAQELLTKLILQGSNIATDPETAELLLQLIISEAHYHCSSANIGPNTILNNLVAKLFAHEIISPDMIRLKTDAWLECVLMDNELTSEEMQRLLYRPQEIRVVRDYTLAPNHAYHVIQKKLYLAMPLIRMEKVTIHHLPSFYLIDDLSSLLGSYYVFWDEEGKDQWKN
jgi:HD superfamily phosphohydrolase